MVISLIIRCGKENKIKLTIEVKNQKYVTWALRRDI
jgi:hypothetical protein